jgi:hypothetical protein
MILKFGCKYIFEKLQDFLRIILQHTYITKISWRGSAKSMLSLWYGEVTNKQSKESGIRLRA